MTTHRAAARALDDAYWRAWLARRGPHVRDRILRFHPTVPDPGELIRGWAPSRRFTAPPPMQHFIGRMTVIRRHGPEVWEALRRRENVLRYGRHHYVAALALTMLLLDRRKPDAGEVEAFLTPCLRFREAAE